MLRINLLLLLVAVICALGTVSANHRARKLVTEYEREQNRMRELDVEWGQLQLEQSTWANHARIEQIARDKLGMRVPPAALVVSLESAK
jgi:cell division protein FtsL